MSADSGRYVVYVVLTPGPSIEIRVLLDHPMLSVEYTHVSLCSHSHLKLRQGISNPHPSCPHHPCYLVVPKTSPRQVKQTTNPPSEDHRGTPEAPGRVVTLIERSYWEALHDTHQSAPDRVWGVAYRIQRDKVPEVKDYLDIREINGYSIQHTPFHPADGTPTIRTLVYIGTPDNAQFAGVQDPQALAEHISRSHGPSGPNPEYLLSLEASLNELGEEAGDEHVRDLSDRVRTVLGLPMPSDKAAAVLQSLPVRPEEAHHRLEHSVEEQEETEKTG